MMRFASDKPPTGARWPWCGGFSFFRRPPSGTQILFDFDGVIADSFEVYFSAFTEVCTELGFDRINSREAFLKLFDGNLIAQLVRAGFPITRLRKLAEQLTPRMEAIHRQVLPFPAMPEILSSLAARYPVYIVTSNHTGMVTAFLDRHGITGIREIIGADIEISKIKKIRRIARYAPRARRWYIGDTLGDMYEGRRAGARCIAVAWGWHDPTRLARGNPYWTAPNPESLTTFSWEE